VTDGGPTAKEHADEPEHEELPNKVRLIPKVAAASGVKTAPVEYGSVLPSVDLSGEIAADPDQTASIAAQVPGRVIAVHFKEGQRVAVGAPLATVESAELARARATLTSATARAGVATKNAERLANLSKDGLASAQDHGAAQAEAAALEADVWAARQALSAFGGSALEPAANAARLVVRSPIAGVVLSRDVVIGQTVGPDHVLGKVAALDRAYFIARVFEKNLAALASGSKADVQLNAYPGETFRGVVESIGHQLDPAARTVVARVALRNHRDLLRIGLFGTARVVVQGEDARPRQLVVPLSAVTRVNGSNVVFVRQPDGDYELHAVTLGASSGGVVEVTAGLREKELVVVDGVFTLKSLILKHTFGEEE
jgi:cobalt-zinc-cadmium efflux system membrane fusion protein